MPNQNEMAKTFHAMGDSTRLAILQRLAKGDCPVGQLSQGSSMALPSFLHHLKVLEEAGLIRTEKRGRMRVCSLRSVTLKDACSWIERTRREWNDRLANLEQYLHSKTS